jgi:hypothetical protein
MRQARADVLNRRRVLVTSLRRACYNRSKVKRDGAATTGTVATQIPRVRLMIPAVSVGGNLWYPGTWGNVATRKSSVILSGRFLCLGTTKEARCGTTTQGSKRKRSLLTTQGKRSWRCWADQPMNRSRAATRKAAGPKLRQATGRSRYLAKYLICAPCACW